jgi:hypothetical protein
MAPALRRKLLAQNSHVARNRIRLGGAEFCGERCALGLQDVSDDDLGTRLDERPHARSTDASAAAADDSHLAASLRSIIINND